MIEIEKKLKTHGLRKTAFRSELLGLFNDSNSSLTAEEIKNNISSTNDRVTIYRALDAFEKSGLIHKVPDKNNLSRYALCQSECSHKEHNHNHVHFVCEDCNETFCIEDIKVPEIKNTKGFIINTSKIILEGICPKCA